MNLYNRKSLINAAPEGKPAKSYKSIITQWLYFIVVILLVGYLLFLLVKPYFILETPGLVDIEVREVLAERDGVIQQVHVEIGQTFDKGDLLATFSPAKQCLAEPDSTLEKLSFDMQVLGNEIEALQREKADLSALYSEAVGMQRALEVNASLFKPQQKQQQDLQNEINKLDNDIKKEQQRLSLMSGRYNSLLAAKRLQPLAEACKEKLVFASEEGQIRDISVLSEGFAAKGLPILRYIPSTAQISVVFLADSTMYRAFTKQPELMVVFPDGIESLGRVARIESVASKVSGNLNDLLAQENVSLRMVLVPADPAHAPLWRTYERLPVSVRGLK